jgi:tRNA modification GTPase
VTPTADATTRISCLTPAGQSALATIAIHGPRAWEMLQLLFRPLKAALPTETPLAGQFWLGRLGGEVADDVVLSVKQPEPVPWLELHTHGGRAVTDYVLDLFREHGVAVCTWEEFLRQTTPDPLRAEAAITLTAAPTTRTAAILLDQYHGAFTAALDAIRQAGQQGDATAVIQGMAELARYAELGRHLTTPWRVVVAGAPNVGKSSLVNALAGFQRSIVASTPGTTRDVVTTRIAIDSWPIELADTAGLRDAAESLEERGIQLARQMLAEADLRLWVLDASTEPVWPKAADGVLLVVNKIDLPSAWNLAEAEGAVRVSARTSEGLAPLCAVIANRLVSDPPPPRGAVPFTPLLADLMKEAYQVAKVGRTMEALALLASLTESFPTTLPYG